MDALDDLALLQLGLGHAADAVGGEVGVPRLDAAQAAQVLVPLLLPLGDQVAISIFFLQAVLVELSGDGLALVEQLKDVPGALVVEAEDGPQGFHFTLAFMGILLSLPHFGVQLVEGGFDQLPAVRWRLTAALHLRHGSAGWLTGWLALCLVG